MMEKNNEEGEVEGGERGLIGLERWEEKREGETDILEKEAGRTWGRGFVNELVCMAGSAQWPRAKSWHATDTGLKLTLTPQIITFSLWKLALPSHSSHSVSVALLFSPALSFYSSHHPPTPTLAVGYWRKNGVDSEKQLPVIYLSLSRSDNEFQVKGEIIIFSPTKSKLWAGTATVTICGMPYGIKGCTVTHAPTYGAHTFSHTCVQYKVVLWTTFAWISQP